MDSLELLAILGGTFSVRQKGSWKDIRESGDSKAAMFLSVANQPIDKQILEKHKKFCKRIFNSKDMYASCWTMNETESMLMWQAYTVSRHGVLIESTIDEFVQSLNLPSYSVCVLPSNIITRYTKGWTFTKRCLRRLRTIRMKENYASISNQNTMEIFKLIQNK